MGKMTYMYITFAVANNQGDRIALDRLMNCPGIYVYIFTERLREKETERERERKRYRGGERRIDGNR